MPEPIPLPTPPLYHKLEELQKAYLEEVNGILGGQDDLKRRAAVADEIDEILYDFTQEFETIWKRVRIAAEP